MKKTLAMVLAMGMTIASLTACGGSKPAETTAAAIGAQTEAASSAADTKTEITEPAGGKAEGPITVVSREDGSGTRGAFIELFGIESKNDAGEKVDNTTEDAEITNSTSVMMTTIAGNKGAIGYVSLGSLNDTVKAVDIDGAEASVDAIKAGEYKEKVEELWKDMAVFKTDTVLRPDYFVCVGPRVCDYSAFDLDQVMLLMDLDIMDREPDEDIIVVASVNDVR